MESIDLKGVEKEVPEVPALQTLSGIKKAGFWLAIFSLSIMTLFILFLIVFFFVSDLDASSAMLMKTSFNAEAFKALSAEKKAYRDFVLEMSKTVLLNLMLPILTAILGYIFGSSREGKA